MKKIINEFTKKIMHQQELILKEISKDYEIQEIRQAPAIESTLSDDDEGMFKTYVYHYVIVKVKT